MGIETILYCFIADEEMFAVEERFAGRELVGTLNSAQIAHTLWKARKNKVRVFVLFPYVHSFFRCTFWNSIHHFELILPFIRLILFSLQKNRAPAEGDAAADNKGSVEATVVTTTEPVKGQI